MLVFRILGKHLQFQFVIIPFLAEFSKTGNFLTAQIHIGASLVQKVNGLVRQESVGNIALRQHNTLPCDFRGNSNPMELCILGGNSLHDLASLFNGRLRNGHRLETALQCSILFDMLAVFVKGCCANHLNFATGQSGFQDVGGIHRTLCITGANQIMNFVNHQNDVTAFLNFADQALHTAFKLAAELCASHQSRQIQQEYFLVTELKGDISGNDPLGEALGNGSFTNAWLTNQTRIILLSAVEDLHHPFCFHITANHRIQLALTGSAGQVHTVAVQELVFLVLFLLGSIFPLALVLSIFPSCRQIPLVLSGHIAAKQLIDHGESGGTAVHIILIPVSLIHLTKHIAHFIAQIVQIFLRKSHILHSLIDLRNA